ncbi:hypothetical protein ABBQ32_009277 [Trebouxia sp. C0010 RCD-2024]
MQSDAAITTYLGCQCDGVVQLRAACQLVRRQLFPVYSNDRLPKTLTAIDEWQGAKKGVDVIRALQMFKRTWGDMKLDGNGTVAVQSTAIFACRIAIQC